MINLKIIVTMNRKKLLISLAMVMLSMAGLAADNLPALRVQGKNLVDANGKTVVLHGVMDTPNRYFNGWRWQQWKADYSEADIQPCLEYFSKQFSAITDKKQGAYCTVFRLHMDPCWTNDPSKKAENEADISAFNMARYRLYLQKLYIPLIKDAIAHGLYVIVRPPGVCPGDISVGDKYNRYLKAIWKAFAADEYIKQNEGVISIELANEPVRVHLLSDGTDSEKALHDYFQPVVDVIREQGFKGIIWVPGAGYQSQYQDYVKYPITDSEDNFSYAVHVYSGWYGNMTDKNYDHDTFIRNFKSQVPMVETKPIMVTEIDWSPEDPDKASEGHYNEWGQWTQPNLGSWATASTSKWGLAWKAVHDHYKEWYLKQNTTGIKQLETQADVVSTLYYNIEGKEVEKPTAGVYIIKQLLSNEKNTFSQGFSEMINFLLHHAKFVSKEIHTFAAVNKQFLCTPKFLKHKSKMNRT